MDREPERHTGLNRSAFSENPVAYIKELDASGELPKVFPAVERCKGVRQSEIKHNEGDVFIHTKMALAKLDQVTPSDEVWGAVTDHKERLLIALALLYHDTGKKERNESKDETKKVDHVEESVKHVAEDLPLHLSSEELALVSEMVDKHERLFDVRNISNRLNKLYPLFCLGGDIKKGRMLLKFLECDNLGRKIKEGHEYHAIANRGLIDRNIGLYRLLLTFEGQKFPVQKISADVQKQISDLIIAQQHASPMEDPNE